MDPDFDNQVKLALVTAGQRHKNQITQIVATGNGVDTTKRTAWFGYRVSWRKAPSRALAEALNSLAPLPPGKQIYASEIDRILLVIDSAHESNDA